MKNIIRILETHSLTWRLYDDKQPVRPDEHRSKNNYEGAYRVLTGLSPDKTVSQIEDSGLKGCGGAGFSIGLKWSLMSRDESMNIRYLLCSVGEIEPGIYKDHLLMEQSPRLLAEDMLISAFVLRAYHGYILLRGEYIEAAMSLCRAIAEATEAGLLGKNTIGTGFGFELFVRTGTGHYIHDKETALINSPEECRANLRSKPSSPITSGVQGKPTCVNNVETLYNVPAILVNDVEWYQSISKSKDADTKLMGFSGRVKNPGLWELLFSITAHETLKNYIGGIRNGLKFKAWQPGGAGTDSLAEAYLDLPMEFKSIGRAGDRLGMVLVMAVDRETNMVPLVRNLEGSFARESCGWCIPCRDGLSRSVKILCVLERGGGQLGDIEALEQPCRLLGPGKTLCAHASGTVEPLQSVIKYFREESETEVRQPFSNIYLINGIQPNLLKERW